MTPPPPRSTLFPYTTLFRSSSRGTRTRGRGGALPPPARGCCTCRSSPARSEEHTSELQSQFHLVCRLLLEKKKNRAPRVGQELAAGLERDLLFLLLASVLVG